MLQISKDIQSQSLIGKRDELLSYLNKFEANYHNNPIQFSKMIFIDSNYHEVVSDLDKKTNSEYLKSYYDEVTEDFFKITISPIRNDYYTNELIIPINMSISDINGKYVGTISTGLSVKKLEEDIEAKFGRKNKQVEINVVSDSSENIIKIPDLKLINIVKWMFPGQELVVTHKVENKPLFLILKIKYMISNGVVARASILSFAILLTTLIVIFLLIREIDNFFQKPLLSAYKKLHSFNEDFNEKYSDIISQSPDQKNMIKRELFNPEEFSNQITSLINKYYKLSQEKTDLMTNHLETKAQIMKIIFLERFVINNPKEEKGFVKKIEDMINEGASLIQIDDFISKVVKYCNDFFNIKINVDIKEVRGKSFVFKRYVLSEAIFNIFSFMMRSKVVNKGSFTISVNFMDKTYLPVITIKSSDFSDNNILSHTSLLSVYTLAKENNLFLNIKKTDGNIYFILEPFLYKKHLYDFMFVRECLDL